MNSKVLGTLLLLIAVSSAQRPGYAGSIPYGYPVIITTTTSTARPAASGNGLGNRFGDASTTTQRLPIEANGDINLINHFNSLPKDQQPFWFLNWQALEEDRKKPHTYPVRESGYNDFQDMQNQQELLPRYGELE